MLATFVGWFMGKDPSKLEIVVPALVAAYTIPNVIADWVWRKWGGPQPTDSATKPNQKVVEAELGTTDGTVNTTTSGDSGG